MVYWKVDVEWYVVSAFSWCFGPLQILNLFEGMILVPSSVKFFSSKYCGNFSQTLERDT